MDDFRVDSVSPYTPRGEPEPADARNRRKPRRANPRESGEDEVVLLSEHPEDSAEPGEDSYSPSVPPREPG